MKQNLTQIALSKIQENKRNAEIIKKNSTGLIIHIILYTRSSINFIIPVVSDLVRFIVCKNKTKHAHINFAISICFFLLLILS